MTSLYTVQKIKKDDTFYGTIHGSDDGYETLCGQEVCYSWYILDNCFEGKKTCKKCLKVLETTNFIKRTTKRK